MALGGWARKGYAMEQRNQRPRSASVLVAAVMAVFLMALLPGAAFGAIANAPTTTVGVQPTTITGNPTCGLSAPNELKVEPVASGTYTKNFSTADGPFSATITISV